MGKVKWQKMGFKKICCKEGITVDNNHNCDNQMGFKSQQRAQHKPSTFK